jgi:hypothetical protein
MAFLVAGSGCERTVSESEQNFPKIKSVTIRRQDEAGEVILVRMFPGAGWRAFTIAAGAAIAASIIGPACSVDSPLTRTARPPLMIIGAAIFMGILLLASTEHEILIDKAAGTLTACKKVLWMARFKRRTILLKDIVQISVRYGDELKHLVNLIMIITLDAPYTIDCINGLSEPEMDELASFLTRICKEPR